MIQTVSLSIDGTLGALPLPLSPVLRLSQPLTSATTPTQVPVPSATVPNTRTTTAQETTSAAGGDERPAKPNSPSEPDAEPEPEPDADTDTETEEEKARRLLYCSLCKVAVNSASQLEAHNSGKRPVMHTQRCLHRKQHILHVSHPIPGLQHIYSTLFSTVFMLTCLG